MFFFLIFIMYEMALRFVIEFTVFFWSKLYKSNSLTLSSILKF